MAIGSAPEWQCGAWSAVLISRVAGDFARCGWWNTWEKKPQKGDRRNEGLAFGLGIGFLGNFQEGGNPQHFNETLNWRAKNVAWWYLPAWAGWG